MNATSLRRVHVVVSVLIVVALIGAGATWLEGARKADLTSHWRDRDIAIDGVNDEWEGITVPIRNAPISTGFFNDGRYLYFCLVTSDRSAQAQIRRQGLIVWIDEDGGKKKHFGLEFPIPMRGMYTTGAYGRHRHAETARCR